MQPSMVVCKMPAMNPFLPRTEGVHSLTSRGWASVPRSILLWVFERNRSYEIAASREPFPTWNPQYLLIRKDTSPSLDEITGDLYVLGQDFSSSLIVHYNNLNMGALPVGEGHLRSTSSFNDPEKYCYATRPRTFWRQKTVAALPGQAATITLAIDSKITLTQGDINILRDLGTPSANEVVRRTVSALDEVLRRDPRFRQHVVRILEELVRCGVRNYQDAEYLRGPARRYLTANAGASRRQCETQFYQPWLRTVLQMDEVLAGRIVAGAFAAGGVTDIMAVMQVPVEAKVIYPDDAREQSVLAEIGHGQAAQYAALPNVAFLSVLDLRRRASLSELPSLENDVTTRRVDLRDGPTPIFVVRVQHACGFERPTDVT